MTVSIPKTLDGERSMRRIVIWLASTVTVVVLLFGYHTSTNSPAAGSGSTVTRALAPSSTSSSSSSSAGSSSSPTGSSAASKSYTGSVAQTRWGPVQVKITVASGRLTGVDVIEYPSGNPNDQEINDYALPVLTKETISAQTASIDMVSGATVTSTGYIESLQSALDKAGI